ncbi:hypothetical protein Ancab_014527 [Ancistrocladus abbreviatus]
MGRAFSLADEATSGLAGKISRGVWLAFVWKASFGVPDQLRGRALAPYALPFRVRPVLGSLTSEEAELSLLVVGLGRLASPKRGRQNLASACILVLTPNLQIHLSAELEFGGCLYLVSF